ncbi:hypothetical protein PROFUN_00613 [Planoprotostelium fungivorum]|uniref:IQ calmodulin-binding motif family protein n=1 Tax=Planoprotostelium fungivorum TaxID=1890364 RepID=A0A2P6NTW4_9EUKA|nr:hypothetical protein PROFUN_00613 [Planoprotostelium fungivorum]
MATAQPVPVTQLRTHIQTTVCNLDSVMNYVQKHVAHEDHRWRRILFFIRRLRFIPGEHTTIKDRQPIDGLLHKDLDDSYWLELIDPYHRYGANLKAYFFHWVRSATTENFFYWLDEGEGTTMSIPDCTRSKLLAERVVFLGGDTRKQYMARIENGTFVWDKDGTPITTTDEQKEDPGIEYEYIVDYMAPPMDDLPTKEERDKRDKELKKGHMPKASSMLALALRESKKQKNAWTYVTDVHGKWYIGAKLAGRFQHSSFLAGSRVTSAGLLQIENGKLTWISPLSGHYKASTEHFYAMQRHIQKQGVEMDSYEVDPAIKMLRALEVISRFKKAKKGSKVISKLRHFVHLDPVRFHPHHPLHKEQLFSDKEKNG